MLLALAEMLGTSKPELPVGMILMLPGGVLVVMFKEKLGIGMPFWALEGAAGRAV